MRKIVTNIKYGYIGKQACHLAGLFFVKKMAWERKLLLAI